MARVEGRHDEAICHYDLAATSAVASGYPQHAALAHELAAAHHARLGNAEAADAEAVKAIEGYHRWGAVRLVKKLARFRKALEARTAGRHPDGRPS